MLALTLRTARCYFTVAIAALITYAVSQGYEVALGEGMDRVTEKDPTTDHMKGSLHEIGLAQDLDLYLGGVYLTDSEDFHLLGVFWEDYGVSHGLPLVWGGNFSKPDGDHFSLRWGGKA
jgi:hypothetical protein